MALQVQQRLAGHVADLAKLEVVQRCPPGPEAVDVVELRDEVDRGPRVPQPPVGGNRVVLAGAPRRQRPARRKVTDADAAVAPEASSTREART